MSLLRHHNLLATGLHRKYRDRLDYSIANSICVPSIRIQRAQNAWLVRRINIGQFALDDILYNFVDDACDINFCTLNFVDPSTFRLSVNGSVSKTSLVGVNGDNSSAWLGTGYTPDNDRVNGSIYSNGYELYTISNTAASAKYEVGLNDTASNQLRHNMRNNSNVTQYQHQGSAINSANSDSSGHYTMNRVDSSVGLSYRNGSSFAVTCGTYTNDIIYEVTLFRHLSTYSNRGLKMFAMGGDYSGLTSAPYNNFNNFLNAI